MPYPFDAISAIDPDNPERAAVNATITLFTPGDVTMAPIAISDLADGPLANPLTVDALGFGPAFTADIDIVAWSSGEYQGLFHSTAGLRDAAVAAAASAAISATDAATAKTAAETAATAATTAVTTLTPKVVPAGGEMGQVLAKSASADFAMAWIPAPTGGGGGGVTPSELDNATADKVVKVGNVRIWSARTTLPTTGMVEGDICFLVAP